MEVKSKTAIIGAGLAGLSAAIRLRKKGFEVHVFEKNERHGGKLDEFEDQGFRFDKGPSLLTEPWLIDELYELWGKNPSDYFSYERQQESCRYFFSDKSAITILGNDTLDQANLTQTFGEKDATNFIKYKRSSKRVFERTGSLFIDHAQPRIVDFLKWRFIKRYPEFLNARFRKTLHAFNSSAFSDKRLIQLFDRYGTYNGSDPYRMSGLYSMIPHLELNLGTYFPKKGMRSIVDGLYALALEIGVEFHFNFNGTVENSKSQSGFSISGESFDKVVCAIDHLTFYKSVFKDDELFKKYSIQERSTSGLVFFIGINTKINELGLHNLFFSSNYSKEFEQITRLNELAEEPSIYVHISSSVNEVDSQAGGQNLFVMVNTPSGVKVNAEYRSHVKNLLFDKIKSLSGIEVDKHIIHESFWDAETIESQTGSYLGALYGSSSNSISATFKRHPNKSKKYKNLYFCGGTVHPGGGIPLVLRSSKIVTEIIE
jgi:phytoene desaturase